MTDTPLEPCPFCGKQPGWEINQAAGYRVVTIVCACGARGKSFAKPMSDDSNVAEAIAAWNRRAPIAPPASAEPQPVASFQTGVADWMAVCFTPAICADQLERTDRFIEEALELAQTFPAFTADRAHALVDYVFGRPVGEPFQEVGGVMVTLAALCNTVGLSIETEANRELARVWTKVEQIRAKQAAKPPASALPVAAPPASAPGVVERVAVLQEAVLSVVAATRAYLPPDGIDAKECLSRILAATDNPKINPLILEAESAAIAAMPDDRASIVRWLRADANQTEQEAKGIVLKVPVANMLDAKAQWDALVLIKRGIADAIERSADREDGE